MFYPYGHKQTFLFNSQRDLLDVNYIRTEDTLFNGLSITYMKNFKEKKKNCGRINL